MSSLQELFALQASGLPESEFQEHISEWIDTVLEQGVTIGEDDAVEKSSGQITTQT